MPVGYWFARICQHFVPVVSSESFCIQSGPTYPDHFIVPYSRIKERENWSTELYILVMDYIFIYF